MINIYEYEPLIKNANLPDRLKESPRISMYLPVHVGNFIFAAQCTRVRSLELRALLVTRHGMKGTGQLLRVRLENFFTRMTR